MKTLREAVKDYLMMRQGLGFKLYHVERDLAWISTDSDSPKEVAVDVPGVSLQRVRKSLLFRVFCDSEGSSD